MLGIIGINVEGEVRSYVEFSMWLGETTFADSMNFSWIRDLFWNFRKSFAFVNKEKQLFLTKTKNNGLAYP